LGAGKVWQEGKVEGGREEEVEGGVGAKEEDKGDRGKEGKAGPLEEMGGSGGMGMKAAGLGETDARGTEEAGFPRSNRSINSHTLHYYSVDFQKEACALHGRTLWRQAVFVKDAVRTLRKRHAQRGQGRRRVIVVGHSYGGLVAKAGMLLLALEEGGKDEKSRMKDVLVTLGSPHRAPPWGLEASVAEFYEVLFHHTGERHPRLPRRTWNRGGWRVGVRRATEGLHLMLNVALRLFPRGGKWRCPTKEEREGEEKDDGRCQATEEREEGEKDDGRCPAKEGREEEERSWMSGKASAWREGSPDDVENQPREREGPREGLRAGGVEDAPASTTPFVQVSISGGFRDTLVWTSLSSFPPSSPSSAPPSLALTTTAMPHVAFAVDHLAILWCRQLLASITKSLIASLPSSAPPSIPPSSPTEQLNALAAHLLDPSIPSSAPPSLPSSPAFVGLTAEAPHLHTFLLANGRPTSFPTHPPPPPPPPPPTPG
jgi:hypothetical protein